MAVLAALAAGFGLGQATSAALDRGNGSPPRLDGPPALVRETLVLGRSMRWRPIRALHLGNPESPRTVLVVGCIHGTECAGRAIVRRLARGRPPAGLDLWLVPNLNPDGLALGVRQNARGVDLNRNFPSQWKPIGVRWDPQYAGPRPLSERETRIARNLIRHVRPDVTIWYHQYRNGDQPFVRAWGGSVPAARRHARLAGVEFRSMPWPNGTAPNWQNHRFPGTASFVPEFPLGPLTDAAARRHARAVHRFVDSQ